MLGTLESPVSAETPDRLTELDVRDSWPLLSRADRALAFQLLSREHAGDFFLSLPATDQADLLSGMPAAEKRTWIRALPPHDASHVVRAAGESLGRIFLSLLDEQARHEVCGLLAHADDRAGGLMDPRYARLRAEMTMEEALWYLRQQLRERRHTLSYAYVLDEDQRLVGVVPYGQLGPSSLALTAYARAEDRERAIRAGFQDHASKPIDPDALVRMAAALARS